MWHRHKVLIILRELLWFLVLLAGIVGIWVLEIRKATK
jgi:hypothetical protein